MSTGLDLLQRLRQQQQQYVKQQSQEKNEQQSTTKDKNEDTHVHKKSSTPSSTTTVEVCLGPDCSGGGGGAALLEIEDLVSCREKVNTTTTSTRSTIYDINNKKNVVVVPGSCRDFCTMGPNVHVRNKVEMDIHYSRVNNPKKCRDIISAIYEEEEASTSVQTTHTNTKDSSVESLMRRREDSIRWQSHKDRAARERRLKVRERNV